MKRSRHGFTLVELIIVIAVIGILAAILIPVFSNVIRKANEKSALSDARNTVEQYMIDAAENPNLPKDIVLLIEKAGEIYLYGFDTTQGGALKVANGGHAICEASEDGESWRAMMPDYSYNECAKTDELPDENKTYPIDMTDPDYEGLFWMIPTEISGAEEEPETLKGFHATKADVEDQPEFVEYTHTKKNPGTKETYHNLSSLMSEKMGNMKVTIVFHAILLPGTFELDVTITHPTTEPTPAPTPKPQFKVTLDLGDRKGDSHVSMPHMEAVEVSTGVYEVQVDRGTILTAGSYAPQYNQVAGEYFRYIFDGWKISSEVLTAEEGSHVVTGDVTMVAQWHKYDQTYTLIFDANDGALKADSVPSEFTVSGNKATYSSVPGGADIASYIKTVKATHSTNEIIGWTDGENVYDGNSAVRMTKDMTLTPVWDVYYSLTLKDHEGHTYNMGKYKAGDEATLKSFTAAGFTLPADKAFDKWVDNNDSTEYAETGVYKMPNSNAVLTAHLVDKFIVTFKTWDGNTILDTIKVAPNTEITLLATAPDREAEEGVAKYEFSGWNCSYDSSFYTKGYEGYTVIANNIVFTAAYEPYYHVSFVQGYNSETVTAMPETLTFKKGDTFNLTTSIKPTYNEDGKYVFTGWSLDNTGTGVTSGSYVVNSSLTFTARWRTRTMLYFYQDSNGSALKPFKCIYADSGTTYTMPTPESLGFSAPNAGDEFVNWKNKQNSTYHDAGSSYTVPSSRQDFWAQWENNTPAEVTYTVTVSNVYDGFNDKSTSSSMTVTIPNVPSTQTSITLTNANKGTTWTTSGNYGLFKEADGYFNSSVTLSLNASQTSMTASGWYVYPFEKVSSAEYVQVNTFAGLQHINHATSLGRNYIQKADIVNTSTNFTCIGWISTSTTSDNLPFTGIYDGGNYKIQIKMNWNTPPLDCGTFSTNNGTVKNIAFYATSAYQVGSSSGGTGVGAIAGTNNGTIYNCIVYTQAANVIYGADGVGGIAGMNYGTIDYCRSQTTVTRPICGGYAGGIAGYNGGTITKSTGYSDPNTILDSTTDEGAGGIAGGSIGGTFIECAYTGRVAYAWTYQDTYGSGGIVGVTMGDRTTIQNCYVKTGGGYICGWNAVGGFIGHLESALTLNYSYACLASVSSYNSAAGLDVGYVAVSNISTSQSYTMTSLQMASKTTTNWDKTNIWDTSDWSLRRARYS